MAVAQLQILRLTHRHRGQAPSHIFLSAFHIGNRQLFGVKKYPDASLTIISLDIRHFFS